MTVESSVVDESVLILAPAATVWRAIAEPEERAAWWSYLDMDAVVGGRFEERWTDDAGRAMSTGGSVLELVKRKLLVLSWADAGWPAETRVEIRVGENSVGTAVRVRHTGWEALPDGARLAAEHRVGWRRHLGNLRAYVENAGGR